MLESFPPVLIQEKDNYVKARQQSLQSNKELIIERRELANLIGAKESDMIVEMDLFKEQSLSNVNPREFVKNSRAIQKFDFDKAKLQRELQSLENKTMPNVNLNLGLSSLGENDKVFEENDIKIVVDKKSFLYLVGTTLEFSGGLNGKGFVFNNPNANRTCGCGESFSL